MLISKDQGKTGNQEQQEMNNMNFTQATATAALAATTVLTGCTRQFPTDREIEARMRDNPARQQRYELTVTLHDAPGPFKYIRAIANYSAPNCSYLIAGKFAGAYAKPEVSRRFDLIQVSDAEWKGIFYTDALLDEDYGFDKGVCHWKFEFVNVYFSANGKREDTLFETSLDEKYIEPRKPVTSYFVKRGYPRYPDTKDGEAGHQYSGDNDRSQFNPDVIDADLFIATLNTRKTS
jgi:hypothetical protein